MNFARVEVAKSTRSAMVHNNRPKLGTYQHYKGNRYELIDIALHSETREEMAVYRALYKDFGLWVRPLAMFLEEVEIGGQKVPRFAFVE